MEYKVLYRKYRPTDFDNIVGQDYIINILKKAIVNSKIAHAYLFCGPRGTGKTTTAKVFAKSINCENNTTGDPCGKCSSCLLFDENSDVIEIDAASNNGVDEIRELKNNVRLVPSQSKYKIYIIDEVHMLSTGAFNALLKTLEEPPSHVIFILATTDPQKIPATVISRCQKFDFHKLNVNVISDYMFTICKQEGVVADKEALDEIAYLADGAMRDALGLLDQVLSSISGKLTVDEIEDIIKTISTKTLSHLYEAIENSDSLKISKIVNDLETDGYDFTLFVNKFVKFLREKAVLVKQNSINSKLNFTKIKNLIFNLNNILYSNRTEISPYLLLEMELLDNIEEISTDELPKKVELVPKHTEIEMVVTPSFDKKSMIKKKNIRVNNCFVKATKEDLALSRKNWHDFQAAVSENNIKLYNYIINSTPVASSNKYIVLSVDNESECAIFNKNIVQIEKEYANFQNNKYFLIGVTKKEWQNYKNKYIEDKKNNINYTMMKETKPKKKNLAETKVGKVAYKLFDEKVIQVK